MLGGADARGTTDAANDTAASHSPPHPTPTPTHLLGLSNGSNIFQRLSYLLGRVDPDARGHVLQLHDLQRADLVLLRYPVDHVHRQDEARPVRPGRVQPFGPLLVGHVPARSPVCHPVARARSQKSPPVVRAVGRAVGRAVVRAVGRSVGGAAVDTRRRWRLRARFKEVKA